MGRPRAETPTFSLTLRNGHYYIQYWSDGAARRVSCRTGRLPEARQALAAFQAAWHAPQIPDSPTIGNILDGDQAEREQRPVSPTLGYNIARLKEVLADLPVDLLNKERVRHYLAARRKVGAGGASAKHRKTVRPLADATLRRELLTLRAALVWAQRERWIVEVPHVEAPSGGVRRERWLTREEAARLLASARQPHIRVFMALALYTAGRAGALLELTWDRVDFARGTVDLGSGRGNKRRAFVPLHDKLRPVLAEAQRDRKSDYVIEHGGRPVASIKTGFRAAAERAGLSGVTPHVLRHTAATWMAQRGVSVDRIAAYLGNSAAMVERVYVHNTPEHMGEAATALGD